MTGLTDAEREALADAIYRGRIRNCEQTVKDWPGEDTLLCRVLRSESERFVVDAEPALTAMLAARLAPIEALAAEYPMCWVHKSAEIFCTDLIGATFPNGTEFTAGACCLPCRVRAALADPQPKDRR